MVCEFTVFYLIDLILSKHQWIVGSEAEGALESNGNDLEN
jgi:hypothetical protein